MKLFEVEMPIKEGGNAIKMSSRINQENVEATLDSIYKTLLPRLNITKSDIGLLGSTGKKAPGDSSGDIDLAISVQAIIKNNEEIETPKELYDFIYKVASDLSPEVKDMRGMGIISLAWPIVNADGRQDNEYVQLDLMTVDSVDWAKWAYYSPAWNESPYKGLYRNELLYAIAKYMDYETLKTALDKEGNEVDVEWKRNFFDLGKGLLTGQQTRMGKKGIVKTTKTINKTLLTADPRKAAKMMFGPDAEPNDLLTWEQTFAAVMDKDFVYADKRNDILKMAKEGILRKGFPVPPELDQVV